MFGSPTRRRLGAERRFVHRRARAIYRAGGYTGSGKTTITNLLMRFYDVQRGPHSAGWRRSARMGPAIVARKLRRSLTDIFLFSGTVAATFAGSRRHSDERVRWAAREVRAEPLSCG